MRRREPEASYRYVYPDSVDLDRVAYFFDYEFDDALPDSAYEGLRRAVAEWIDAWKSDQPPVLRYWSSPGFLQIYDGRQPGCEGTYTFRDCLADIYVACSERPVSASAVHQKLQLDMPIAAVEEAFEEFRRRGLMFLDESRAIALALPAIAGR
jgi:hypothetical protein